MPTRERTRTDENGNTVKGAVLDQAKGHTGNNYKIMGINDYATPQGESKEAQKHVGGELIYYNQDNQTVGGRMEQVGATFFFLLTRLIITPLKNFGQI